MGIPIVWICKKCGRQTSSSRKPGENGTDYGRCPKGGDHNWAKK